MTAVATAATRAAGLALTPRWLSYRADPVADAADGLDPHSGASELGAQPGQVDVDGIGAERVGLVVPDVLGDRAAGGVTRGTSHEDLRDTEFGAGQRRPLAADKHLPRGRVELEFPDLHTGRLADRRTALQRPEPGQSLAAIERVCKVDTRRP